MWPWQVSEGWGVGKIYGLNQFPHASAIALMHRDFVRIGLLIILNSDLHTF